MNLPARIEPEAPGQWVELMKPAADLAVQIANTDFVPEGMRGKPAAVAACILYGHELGLGPMQALAKVNVIKGRPAPSAELGRALALAHGHEVWVEDATNTRVIVCGRRRGSDAVHRVQWTMDDVKRAGLGGHQYQKYPRQMLLARASAELVRQMCPDALGGITVFAEEVGDDEMVMPVGDVAAAAAPKSTRQRARAAVAAAPEPPPPPLPDEPDPEPALAVEAVVDVPLPVEAEPPAGTVTAAQIKAMQALMSGQGVTSREDRVNLICNIVGRQVGSSKELSKDEAGRVVDALVAVDEGRAELKVDAELGVLSVEWPS